MSEKTIPARPLPEAESALIARVDEHKGELVELLKKLVAIDSRVVNLETFSDQSRIFALVEAFMKEAGAKCEYYRCPHLHGPATSKQSWPSLIAAAGEGGGKTLQFCGHLDVVPFTPESWVTDPLVAVEKDGKVKLPEGFRNLQKDIWKDRWEAFLLEHPFDVELSVISSTPGTFEDPNRPFSQLLSEAFEDVYHVKAVHFFAPGSSDAVFFRGGGIKDVVLFGPTGGHMHDANEFVDIGDLVRTCKVYLLVAYRMLCKTT